ncbi:hypothetical protein PGTUg99_032546 [Puccinia graminis f. sp. tritici]|uniref:hAT-like transposase RNase-H fold domain-containing protein n=2 Tax=Puccinia graminis f. sp. tritici TaxID=56615 RepID=A0A5B0QRF1_PUCGR|nr:hypothetical protein PGTUg99_032546 [Puccinia graminis f. sp. tritici]
MARSSVSPRGTPSQTPSRQSSRITTPLRSHGNFVRSNRDSRRSLQPQTSRQIQTPNPESETESVSQTKSTQPFQKLSRKRHRPQISSSTDQSHASAAKSKQKKKKKKKNVVRTNNEDDSDQVGGAIDITQDSDHNNSKVKKVSKNDSEFDNILAYFEPPYHANKGDTGDKSTHRCKWCSAPYKKSKGTNSNLTKHRDGTKQCPACSGRSDAITFGAKLPLTAMEIEFNKQNHEEDKIHNYAQNTVFEMRVLNQLLVMWLIRYSLPWSRMQDFLLRVALNYAWQNIIIYGRSWAANEAHNLYINLQSKVIASLHALESKFTLIHDVWTTKGNHHAFLGISVAYVTKDWFFKISHLGMKYIASNQQGRLLAIPFANILKKAKLQHKITQTTDSGSNNFTMASEVDRLISKKTGVNPNLSANHIRCFCHKIALILNAGLKALRQSTDGLVESRGDTLGFAPDLEPIIEESEEREEPDQFVAEDVALEFCPQGQAKSRTGSDGCNGDGDLDSSDIPDNGGSNIDTVLKKVGFIIQRITSSAAKRSEYKTWCTKLDFNGLSLIAGYSIRWNIVFQSRHRGYQARKIIDKLIENENDRQEQEGGKNYFDSVEVSRSEWEMVNRLNDTLSEFYFLTKKMEGDHSSGCLLISEYQYIKEFLTEKIESSSEPEFKKMLEQMLAKTNTYLNEALRCDVILIATALNPSFRLSIFKFSFPSHHNHTQNLLESLFNTRKAEISVPTESAPPVAADKSKSIKQARKQTDYFPDSVKAPVADELAIYLGGP